MKAVSESRKKPEKKIDSDSESEAEDNMTKFLKNALRNAWRQNSQIGRIPNMRRRILLKGQSVLSAKAMDTMLMSVPTRKRV